MNNSVKIEKVILKNRLIIMPLLIFCTAYLWACTSDDEIQPPVNKQETIDSLLNNSIKQNENTTTMKLKITIGDTSLVAVMYDNSTAKDFMSMLPLTLNFEDYAQTEKIAYLDRNLSTKNSVSGCNPDIGDITYYAPWGNLAIFYKDYEYASGLIKLGKIEEDISFLNSAQELTVTFERVI